MSEFDRGPSVRLARLFSEVPDPPVKADFWFDWGPVFYRGRLDGSARVLCVASDPGPTERIAGRSLVGNAGQRVQGLLAKLGLTRSYLCLNAWVYALHPSRAWAERARLDEPAQLAWRNELYDAAIGPDLQAIIAFGRVAQEAVALWSGRPDVALCEVPHPTSHDAKELLDEWRAAVSELRAIVTPDSDGDNGGPRLRHQLQRGRLCGDPAPRSALRGAGVPRRRRLAACKSRSAAKLGGTTLAR